MHKEEKGEEKMWVILILLVLVVVFVAYWVWGKKGDGLLERRKGERRKK